MPTTPSPVTCRAFQPTFKPRELSMVSPELRAELGPDNDDDAGNGDYLPEQVYLESETGSSGVRDGVDVGTGDGTPDDYETVVAPALEADAIDFADYWSE